YRAERCAGVQAATHRRGGRRNRSLPCSSEGICEGARHNPLAALSGGDGEDFAESEAVCARLRKWTGAGEPASYRPLTRHAAHGPAFRSQWAHLLGTTYVDHWASSQPTGGRRLGKSG